MHWRAWRAAAAWLLMAVGAEAQGLSPGDPGGPEPGVPEPGVRDPSLACQDEVQNGAETDRDCGGDCLPCWHGKLCALPSDCASGLCAEGRCRERQLESGAGIPPGYEVRLSRRDAPGTARLAGLAFLVPTYLLSYLAAAGFPSGVGALYIPVLGPWISLGKVDTPAARAVLVADGSLQLAGTVLLVAGFALAGRQLLRLPPTPQDIALQRSPRTSRPKLDGLWFSAGSGPVGLGVRGSF